MRWLVIPKRTAGKWQLIADMSNPEGASINDGIRESICILTYMTVSDAVQSIMQLGQGYIKSLVVPFYRCVTFNLSIHCH